MKELSGRVRTYIAVLAIVAAYLVYLTISPSHTVGDHPALVDLAWFAAMFMLADAFPVFLPGGGAYSVSFVIVLAAIITRQGPEVATAVAAFALFNLRKDQDGRTPIVRRVFNASQLIVATAAAGFAYQQTARLIGVADRLPSLERPHHLFDSPLVLVPVLAAAIAYFLVNTWLVAFVLSMVHRENPAKIWVSQFETLLAANVAFALLGFLLADLDILMGPAVILFLLVPLVVARHAFQASVQMAEAYDRTVLSLITAIEKKDSYTKHHARRVARLSEMVARGMGLPRERVRLVRFAALMHDVGKLGVSTKILQKAGKLTPDEYEHMKAHPIRGHEIVGEIDFLREAVGAVRHHHERMDGGGYPDGLVGEEIPLLARIIMVSDAFDSMTSTRVYRKAKSFDEALMELHRCEGTQFDGVCLAALERAIAQHGWEAFPEEEHEADATAAAL